MGHEPNMLFHEFVGIRRTGVKRHDQGTATNIRSDQLLVGHTGWILKLVFLSTSTAISFQFFTRWRDSYREKIRPVGGGTQGSTSETCVFNHFNCYFVLWIKRIDTQYNTLKWFIKCIMLHHACLYFPLDQGTVTKRRSDWWAVGHKGQTLKLEFLNINSYFVL